MKKFFIVAILLFFFNSCSEEKIKISQLPISSTNIEAISFFNKALIHEMNFEFDEADNYYNSAISIDPNFILAHIQLFRQASSNSSYIDLSNKNTDLIESLISNGTEYEKILFEMYKIPYRRSDSSVFNKRLKIAQKLVDLYPKMVEPLTILAKQIPNYTINNDWNNLREKSLLKALKIDPKNIVASEELFYFKYGGSENSRRFRIDLDFYESFDKDAEELISKFPNSPRILRRVGNLYRNSYDYIDASRYEKSIDAFDKLLLILKKTESSFIKDVLKYKADLLINIDRREECYETMILAVNSSKSLNKKLDAIFSLVISYISGGDYLKAIKYIDKFEITLDEGLYDFNGEEISRKLWLKCKVSLNLYKAIIFAHANQPERAQQSLGQYKDYAKKTFDYNNIKTDLDFQKYYSENDISSSRLRWKTIHPQQILNNEAWVSVLIGDDSKIKDILDNLPDNSMWRGIHTVIKGDFVKGLEILSNHESYYSQYFKAQALIGLGKIGDAKDILDNLRYLPYHNFETSWTKNRAARLYQTL